MSEKSMDEMTDEEIQNMAPPSIEEDPSAEEDTQEQSTEQIEENQETDEADEKTETSASDATPEIDYKGFYDSVMSPIKANGKELHLRSPQEAVKLIQMGANYTQKMQTLAPYRKKIQMLQKAGLLEDEKLNYLIDLSQGNPEAVKKLLKDSKLDPLDLDISSNQAYTPGNHTVSDEEVRFQTVVDDLKSTPEGMQTLQMIQGWDQASLSELWANPSLMMTLNEQRQNGVYNFIMNEVEHQKMLGNIPEGTSFLEAYKRVGDYCLKMQMQQQQMQMQNLPQGTLKRPETNSNQVKSAAPSGRSKKNAQRFVDPFSLSDEEFEKEFSSYSR